MSNSALVNYTAISPNSNNPRNAKIRKITIHHMAGNLSVEQCGNAFASTSREASANYGVDSDGRVGMYVEEANRAWTSSSPNNDNQAITIEVANDGGAPDWHVSDTALAKVIDLCVDICKRNGIAQLNFTGDANGNLTMHRYFAPTTCPGPYLANRFPYIAKSVNDRLSGSKVPQTVTVKPVSTPTSTTTVTQSPDVVLQANIGGHDGWLGKVYGHLSNIGNEETGCAGKSGRTIEAICLSLENANFVAKYAVSPLNGHFYPAVSSADANLNDKENGFAGMIGTEIDGVRMWLEGTSEYDIEYQVTLANGKVESPVFGKDAGSSDGNISYAGKDGERIAFITAKIVHRK